MLDIILITIIVTGWIIAMVWAYKDNGGMKEFRKSFKRIINRMSTRKED